MTTQLMGSLAVKPLVILLPDGPPVGPYQKGQRPKHEGPARAQRRTKVEILSLRVVTGEIRGHKTMAEVEELSKKYPEEYLSYHLYDKKILMEVGVIRDGKKISDHDNKAIRYGGYVFADD